jgi:hypothetical protein
MVSESLGCNESERTGASAVADETKPFEKKSSQEIKVG